jgi:putative CocE/NonD family hydrolase
MTTVARTCALSLCFLTVIATAVAHAASPYPGNGSWTPGPRSYGYAGTKYVHITMNDGVQLNANVYYPTELSSGAAAPGPFPIILAITPYAIEAPGLEGSAASPEAYVPYGYIYVEVDVRGTGGSGGEFDLAGPREQQDYQEVIAWVSKLPHSDHKVGMEGASYLGLTSLLAAGGAHRGSPLKAIFPVVGPSDLYRDLIFPGGIFNSDFTVPYALGLEVGLDAASPVFGPPHPEQFISTEEEHIKGILTSDVVPIVKGLLLTEELTYDGTYWQQRQPDTLTAKIAANGVATFVYNVWFDVWQRGDTRVYNELQNGQAGRPPDSPMLPGQPASGKFQEAIGPYTHEGSGSAPTNTLALEWFDTWLKGQKTGMANTRTPFHAYEVLGHRWIESATWPLRGTGVETYYFGPGPTGTAVSLNNGSLSTSPPTAGSTAVLPWNAATSPCSRMSDQELIFGPVKGIGDLEKQNVENPCFFDDRTLQATGLTYTSSPFEHAMDIGGPIGATIYAKANTTETEWVVAVDDVSPDGSSRPLATGDLLGSLRQSDPKLSWTYDGKVIAPGHPYSKASQSPVTPGEVTRYEIEIPPILARIEAGHHLRIAVNSADTPYLLPTLPQLESLVGGVYDVYASPEYPSAVDVPLVDPQSLKPSTIQWGPCVSDC